MFSTAKIIVFSSILALLGSLLLYSYALTAQLRKAERDIANATTKLETKEKECQNTAIAYNAIGELKQLEGAYHETNTTTDDNITVTIDLDSLFSKD